MNEVTVTVGKCKYCGRQTVLINNYGSCPANCPGNIIDCKEYKCKLPPGYKISQDKGKAEGENAKSKE